MSFFTDCVKGIVIGAGAILPGISSGVLCVIFGIYEKLLDNILNFFSEPKKNLKFLFPIVIGVFIGVVAFSNILNYLLYTFPIQTKSVFIGLILGSIPSLIKEVNKKVEITFSSKLKYTLFAIFAFLIGVFSVILEKHISISTNANVSFLYFVISGFIMSIGIVVPGVSSTIILMLLGIYTTYISSVACLYLPVLIPMGIGLIFGCLIFMKLTKFLLEHFYPQTFYTIIGFTLGSIIVLVPKISSSLELLISVLCLLFRNVNLGTRLTFNFIKERDTSVVEIGRRLT